MYIPTKLIVSVQKRSEVSLAFITYKNSKNVLMKQNSFETWESKSNTRFEIDNILMEGFQIVSLTKRSSDWFGSGRTMFYIEHPNKEFVFEISSNNLLEILKVCEVQEGVIKNKCIICFGGNKNEIVLVPENTELYKDYVKITSAINEDSNIFFKDMKVGQLVKNNKNEKFVYLGVYETFKACYEGGYNSIKVCYLTKTKIHVLVNKEYFYFLPYSINSKQKFIDCKENLMSLEECSKMLEGIQKTNYYPIKDEISEEDKKEIEQKINKTNYHNYTFIYN